MDVVRAADAHLEHAAAPDRDVSFTADVVDAPRRRQTADPAGFDVDDARGPELDRLARVIAGVDRLIEADRGLDLALQGGVSALLVALAALAAGQDKPQEKPQEKQAEGSECRACHEDKLAKFDRTYHAGATQGCLSCHKGGEAHMKGRMEGQDTPGPKLGAMTAEDSNAVCQTCHEKSHNPTWLGSAHARRGVRCTDCHSVHKPKTPEKLLLAKQPTLCYSCHLEAKPDFSKPFHHRVNEGLVGCTDCHNPHGGFLTKQLRATAAQDQVCFKCHSEKAGPFVFEHAPLKTEGCVACHTPHGSSNPRLLKRANVNLLCLECHTFTVDSIAPAAPSFHNQAQKYQACTMCHTQIHGSNFDHIFFR